MPNCNDCRGSGRYVGLSIVDMCRSCGGSGTVSSPDGFEPLLSVLPSAYAVGTWIDVVRLLDAVLVEAEKTQDALPPGADIDHIRMCIGDEVDRLRDIALAPPEHQPGLMLRSPWDGVCCGLRKRTA